MKTKPTKKMNAGLMAFAWLLGIVTGAHAGGPALLQLPIEGVTAKNSNQCAQLFEETLGGVVFVGWNISDSGGAKGVKDGSTNLVQLQLVREHVSLSDVEKALEGSPFNINREQLEYIGIVRLRIGKNADHEKLVSALATLDGKKLSTNTVKDKDGSLLITLSARQMSTPLITHQHLTSYLANNKINLIAINWGAFHCRAPYGARPAAAAVAQK